MGINSKNKELRNTGKEKLVFDIRPILSSRGIKTVHSYLNKTVGLPNNLSSKLSKGQPCSMTNKYMEKLCVTLKCTPNDLYFYIEDPNKSIGFSHPLAQLYKLSQNESDVFNILKDMTPNELKEFHQYLKTRKKG